jgi:hypothetical protein
MLYHLSYREGIPGRIRTDDHRVTSEVTLSSLPQREFAEKTAGD